MTVKRIIPCLDVDEGRVVKGVKFEGVREVGDPVEFARRYNAEGADELCFMDMGATSRNRGTLLDVVRKVAAEVSIPLCVGGGVRTVEDMRATIEAGANKVSVCSAALSRPELLSDMAGTFGSQCTVLAIDAKRVPGGSGWHAFSGGGRIDTGLDAVEWAKRAVELGVGEILLNSIDADGTGAGYDLELCSAIVKAVPVPVIASGGAGSLDQIVTVLSETGVDAALVASLLHFGKTSIPEIKKYVESKGIPVRR